MAARIVMELQFTVKILPSILIERNPRHPDRSEGSAYPLVIPSAARDLLFGNAVTFSN